MSRSLSGSRPAFRGLRASLFVLAAILGGAGLSAQAAPGAAISKVATAAAAKLGSCIVPTISVSVSPGSLAFSGPVLPGNCHPSTLAFTVTNTGTARTWIDASLVLSDYLYGPVFLSTDCYGEGYFLPGESCAGSVTFCPYIEESGRPVMDMVSVNWENGALTIPVAGVIGPYAGPAKLVTADMVDLQFGTVPVNQGAPPRTVTFTNRGDTTVTGFLQPPAGGQGFTLMGNACGLAGSPVALAPGGSCAATVGFTAPILSSFFDSMAFTSDAMNGPYGMVPFDLYVNMYGYGGAWPEAAWYPQSLDFGTVPANSSSAPQAVSFANTGTAPMTIASPPALAGAEFIVSHDCPGTLAAQSCCTIEATFVPTILGPQAATIDVSWSDGVSTPYPESIPVQGEGIAPPSITFSPASVAFPDQIVGTLGGPVQVYITNSGVTTIALTSLGVTAPGGDFSVGPLGPAGPAALPVAKAAVPPCALAAMPPGAACFANVYFSPTAVGLRTGTLVLAFSGGVGSPASVPLSGNGSPSEAPGIAVSPEAIAFGEVVVGTTSSRTVTVASTGTGPLAVFGVRTYGPFFSASTTCSDNQAPGSSCEVVVSCTPDATQPQDGDLYIDHSAESAYAYVKLECTGVPLPAPKIEVSAAGVSFGRQSLGTTSLAYDVVIRSVGTAPLAVGGLGTTAPFTAGTNCPASLEPGATCRASVSFTPARPGPQAGRLGIASNDPARPVVNVDLSGTGCRPFSIMAARRGINLCGP